MKFLKARLKLDYADATILSKEGVSAAVDRLLDQAYDCGRCDARDAIADEVRSIGNEASFEDNLKKMSLPQFAEHIRDCVLDLEY